MKTITIQLSTQDDPVSLLIRSATWSKWSHVDVQLKKKQADGTEYFGLLGARADGGVKVRPMNYTAWKEDQYIRYNIDCGDVEQKAFWQFLSEQVGRPYDFEGIADFTMHKDHNWKEDDSWFCSELVAAAFAHAGIPWLNIGDCNRVSPRDIELIPYLYTEAPHFDTECPPLGD